MGWGSLSFLRGPVVALIALGVILVLCRWVFARPVTRPARTRLVYEGTRVETERAQAVLRVHDVEAWVETRGVRGGLWVRRDAYLRARALLHAAVCTGCALRLGGRLVHGELVSSAPTLELPDRD